jgi:competence protein ComEC
MLLFHQVALRRGLRPSGLGLLGLTATVFLLIDPSHLHSVAATLSFSATLGILHLTRPLALRLKGLLPRATPPTLRTALAASLGATLGSLPVTVVHFGQVPLLSPLVNLLAIPLGSLLVPLAFLLSLAAYLHPSLALTIHPILFAPLVKALDLLAGMAATHLPVLKIPLPPPWVLTTGSLLLYHWGASYPEKRRKGP